MLHNGLFLSSAHLPVPDCMTAPTGVGNWQRLYAAHRMVCRTQVQDHTAGDCLGWCPALLCGDGSLWSA